MADGGFSEITNESWFSRIGNAFKGILIGVIMFFGAFVLLFWNEGRAVDRERTLNAGIKAVVSVEADKVDPANDGKLVHMTGEATTDETLTDPMFQLSEPQALQLNRSVQMFQWKENVDTRTEKQIGGGQKTIKTYTYTQEWSSSPIDSGRFNPKAGNKRNPPFPVRGDSITTDKATIGAFRLPKSMVRQIGGAEQLPVTQSAYEAMSPQIRQQYQLNGDLLYATQATLRSTPPPPNPDNKNPDPDNPDPNPDNKNPDPDNPDPNPDNPEPNPQDDCQAESTETSASPTDPQPPVNNIGGPQIGDVKVSFSVVKPQEISLMAEQVKDTFGPYKTESAGTLEETVVRGAKSADVMFQDLKDANNTLTWILRLVGWVIMGLGIYLVVQPLVVFADVLPILGNILGAGVGIMAALISLVLSLITIGIAWVFYRPMFGIGILAVAGLIFAGFWYFSSKKKADAKPAG